MLPATLHEVTGGAKPGGTATDMRDVSKRDSSGAGERFCLVK